MPIHNKIMELVHAFHYSHNGLTMIEQELLRNLWGCLTSPGQVYLRDWAKDNLLNLPLYLK